MSSYTGTFFERKQGQSPTSFILNYTGFPMDIENEMDYRDEGLDLYDSPGSDHEIILYVHDQFFLFLTSFETYVCNSFSQYAKESMGLLVHFEMNDTAMGSEFKLYDKGKRLAQVEYEETTYSIKIDGVDFANIKDAYEKGSDVMTTMGKLIPKLLDPELDGEIEMKRYLFALPYNENALSTFDEKQLRIAHVRQYLSKLNSESIYEDDIISQELLQTEIDNADINLSDYPVILKELQGKSQFELDAICARIGSLETLQGEDIAILMLANYSLKPESFVIENKNRDWQLPKRTQEEYIFDREIHQRKKEKAEENQIKRDAEEIIYNIRKKQRESSRALIKENKIMAARVANPEFDINAHYFNMLMKGGKVVLEQPDSYTQLVKSLAVIRERGQTISPLPIDYLRITAWNDEKLNNARMSLRQTILACHKRVYPYAIESVDQYIQYSILSAETTRRTSAQKSVELNKAKKKSPDDIITKRVKIIGIIIAVIIVFAIIFRGCTN